MRHLGVLWVNFNNPEWRIRTLTEAVFRIAKNTLQSLMRSAIKRLEFVSDEPYIRLIVGFINLFFGETEDSQEYWQHELRWNLEENFFFVGDCKKHLKGIGKDLKKNVDLLSVMERLPSKLGLEMRPNFMKSINIKGFFRRAVVMKVSDVLSLYPIVTSGMTEYPRAFISYEQVSEPNNGIHKHLTHPSNMNESGISEQIKIQ